MMPNVAAASDRCRPRIHGQVTIPLTNAWPEAGSGKPTSPTALEIRRISSEMAKDSPASAAYGENRAICDSGSYMGNRVISKDQLVRNGTTLAARENSLTWSGAGPTQHQSKIQRKKIGRE